MLATPFRSRDLSRTKFPSLETVPPSRLKPKEITKIHYSRQPPLRRLTNDTSINFKLFNTFTWMDNIQLETQHHKKSFVLNSTSRLQFYYIFDEITRVTGWMEESRV